MNGENNQVNMQKECIINEESRRELIDNSLRLMAIVSQRLHESVELIHMNKDKFHNSMITKDTYMGEQECMASSELVNDAMVTIEEIANASEGLEIISEGLQNLIRMFTRTQGLQK